MAAPGRHAARPSFPVWLAAIAAIVGAAGIWNVLPPDSPLDDTVSDRIDPVPINTSFAGLTTFRGNASRTYHGEGPVPDAPVVRWRVPARKMCSLSTVGLDGTPRVKWCGTGWTGQPNVVPGRDGSIEIREGAYDRRYHFLDGNGRPTRPPFMTGDLAKGSATTDPDGFPLYYAGSRDNLLRVVALDRGVPTVLWSIDADTSVPRPLWNDDWDGAPMVVDDVLFEGGENGWIYAIRLHRGYDAQGLVTVAPEVVATKPSFDEPLLEALGDLDVSVESSVALDGGTLYAANSGGLVTGWDVSDILDGGTEMHRVFRFWTGDDTDATIVVDHAGGDLYVASEYQRFGERSRAFGQLLKLDPGRRGDPLVWGLDAGEIGFEGAGGSWSTPALWGDHVYFTTASGRVLSVEAASGSIDWEAQIAAPTIGSPVVVDGVLVQGDCSGNLHAWRLDPSIDPVHLWSLDLGECVESTPAVWQGWLYVGTREGYLYGVADRGTPVP